MRTRASNEDMGKRRIWEEETSNVDGNEKGEMLS